VYRGIREYSQEHIGYGAPDMEVFLLAERILNGYGEDVCPVDGRGWCIHKHPHSLKVSKIAA
jgi:hypothetical protein